jgi:hypothetical protein
MCQLTIDYLRVLCDPYSGPPLDRYSTPEGEIMDDVMVVKQAETERGEQPTVESIPNDLGELFEEVSQFDPMISALTRRC